MLIKIVSLFNYNLCVFLTAPRLVTNYVELRRERVEAGECLSSGCPQTRSKGPQNTHTPTHTHTLPYTTHTTSRRCQQHATAESSETFSRSLSFSVGVALEVAVPGLGSQVSVLGSLFVGDTNIKGNCRRSFPAQT